MKNKILIISLSVLAFIVLIVILSSTVFCLKTVEINFMSNTVTLTNKETEIIETGEFKYNQNIFFVSKNNYIKNLEEKNPYLKVVNIETSFPNKLVINAVERNELFAIKGYEENEYKYHLILDDELKILATIENYTNLYTNPILVTINGENTLANVAGQTLNSLHNNTLTKLAVELYAYNNNPLMLKANFEEIILNYSNKSDIKIVMRSGVNIVLKNAETKLTEKFMLALSYYNGLENKTIGTITTYEDSSNNVVGYYF